MRGWCFAVTDNHSAALLRRFEEQLRKIVWQPDAAMARGITGQLSGMHGNASPGKPLHVRQRRIVVLFRTVSLFFLKNAEDTAGSGMSFRACAHSWGAKQNTVAIHVHGLLWNAHQYDHRAARRELRVPPVLAGLELSGWFTGGCTFGVERRLLHCGSC